MHNLPKTIQNTMIFPKIALVIMKLKMVVQAKSAPSDICAGTEDEDLDDEGSEVTLVSFRLRGKLEFNKVEFSMFDIMALNKKETFNSRALNITRKM